jgi:ABC-type Fe3+/spermidine/putrescine transport system ATPase subunit
VGRVPVGLNQAFASRGIRSGWLYFTGGNPPKLAYDLQLSHVGKVFDNGTAAVIDFNLDVNKGEFIAFLGPSGCGKTTTLRMIAGFEDISSGDISIRGERINDLLPEQRPTSMIFQNYALFPHMTVRENVGFGLDVKNMPTAERDAKVTRILEKLDLMAVQGQRPDRLSGGQRQRIALARSLVVEHSVARRTFRRTRCQPAQEHSK